MYTTCLAKMTIPENITSVLHDMGESRPTFSRMSDDNKPSDETPEVEAEVVGTGYSAALLSLRPAYANKLPPTITPPPPWLTKAFRETVLRSIAERCVKPRDACIDAGLTASQYSHAKRQVDIGLAQKDVVALFEDMDRALAGLKIRLTETIAKDPSRDDVKWLLEKMFPNDFGKVEVVRLVRGEIEAMIARFDSALASGFLTPQEYEKFLQLATQE